MWFVLQIKSRLKSDSSKLSRQVILSHWHWQRTDQSAFRTPWEAQSCWGQDSSTLYIIWADTAVILAPFLVQWPFYRQTMITPMPVFCSSSAAVAACLCFTLFFTSFSTCCLWKHHKDLTFPAAFLFHKTLLHLITPPSTCWGLSYSKEKESALCRGSHLKFEYMIDAPSWKHVVCQMEIENSTWSGSPVSFVVWHAEIII